MQLSLLASTPDIATTGYMVNLLLGTPELVAAEAKAAGYDGIEFIPGAPGTIGVAEMDRALEASDVVLTAVNSGRIVAEGLTLLHADPAVRGRASWMPWRWPAPHGRPACALCCSSRTTPSRPIWRPSPRWWSGASRAVLTTLVGRHQNQKRRGLEAIG